MPYVLLRRVRVHVEEHSKPWWWTIRKKNECWTAVLWWIQRKARNVLHLHSCASNTHTEHCLGVEMESHYWWSHLSFIKHKATMVDRKEQKQQKKKSILHKPARLINVRHRRNPWNRTLIYLHNDSENLPLNLHLVQYQPQMTHQRTNSAPTLNSYSTSIYIVLPEQHV